VTPLDLRPLSIGEVLDRSFRIYRGRLSLYVGIMAVPQAFGLALALVVQTLQFLYRPQFDNPEQLEENIPLLIGLFAAYLVVGAVYFCAYMLALGATTLAVSEEYAGRTTDIRGAFRHVRGRFGSLMLLALVAGLRLGGISVGLILLTGATSALLVPIQPVLGGIAIFIGMMTSMLLAAFLALRYAMCVPALMLEHLTARPAILRSIFLTSGHLWRVFLVVLCTLALTYAALAFFQMPFMVGAIMAGVESMAGLILTLIGTVTGSIGGVLVAPIMIIGFVVMYYDLRIRKEALDLQMMMGALDAGRADTPPAAPALPALSD